ncbi:MAG: general secretion pathway protein E [Gammaproteobacteria bacterium]|jgi:general secretion pathway protein E
MQSRASSTGTVSGTTSLNSVSDEVHTSRKITVGDVLRILLQRNILSEETAKHVRAQVKPEDTRHPFLAIGELRLPSPSNPSGHLNSEFLTRVVADACNMPYLRIDPLKIDVETVTGIVSQAYASRFQFLAVELTDSYVTIATPEPYVDDWSAELAPILKRDIRRVLANPADVEKFLKEFYGVSRSLSGAANKTKKDRVGTRDGFEQLTELGVVGELDSNDQHVVHLADWLLQYAFDQRASDIHIEPRRGQGSIRFRIDGVLHLVHELAMPTMAAITSRLKSLGRMDVADKRRPQDGRIKTRAPGGREVELRLSTMPTTFGEKLVLRVFDPDKLTQPFSALGFSLHDETLWNEMTRNPHGIVLVTGPTGSGKTTTLYSALKQLARPEINVCTIEDPIEMVEAAFNQMQVQPAIDLDFAAGVRTLLRQDPDVIMIGEVRDRETADVAIQAALTGHLVLSTLHTNDAPSAITRLMDIGIPSYLIGATLLGVIAQRLVRTLCSNCKEPMQLTADAWHSLIGSEPLDVDRHVHRAVGCDECRNTGFKGREGVYEILQVTPTIGAMIVPDAGTMDIRRRALDDGMVPLSKAGALKVAAGRTTLEEVLSVSAATTT